jgi:spermidine synthase
LPILLVFAGTLFLSALLLFLVEPMVGKMILPMLGGSPAVWNTCMVFYQAMLLVGYLYAHLTTTWLGPRKQAGLHLVLMALPFLVLPIAVNKALAPEGEANPVFGVLLLLTAAVGLPFLVVSASAPLLQKWFASTDHPAAKDPYFLYGASNLGSMLALACYPVIIERKLAIYGRWGQSWTWSWGYGLLAASTAVCAYLMWRSPPAVKPDSALGSTAISAKQVKKRRKSESHPEPPLSADRPVTVLRRLHWIALAFVPSSLLLGVTTYITTDIAAIPLLWVLPLGLYLLSFILVFSRLPGWVHKVMILIMPLMVLLLAFMLLSHLSPKQWQNVLFHPLVLFVVAMVCHGELARDRPATSRLTEFYVWMSVGGVLGGLFNAILAPVLFNGIVEYQLVLIMACLLMPRLSDQEGEGFGFKIDLAVAASLAVLAFAAFYAEMHHLHDQARPYQAQVAEYEKSIADMRDKGDEIPPWLFGQIAQYEDEISRLHDESRTMLIGQGMAIGFLLLAPLGWFVSRDRKRRGWWFDAILPVGLGLLSAALLLAFYDRGWEFEMPRQWVKKITGSRLDLSAETTAKFLVFGLPALLCYIFVERPLRFGLAVAAFLVASGFYNLRTTNVLHQERSYFGVLKVTKLVHRGVTYHSLTHGTTMHGMQCMNEDRRADPLTYYHRNGPVGQLFATYPELTHDYAVIGLGTGTMAAYGDRDHKVTYYEIDRHVREIARNPEYFTYLTDYAQRRGEDAEIVLGDARLQMEKAKLSEKYGIILVDAFSSDAIPVHLITREAVQILFDKTVENGIVAYHVSNRWLELTPVLDRICQDLGYAALVKHDGGDNWEWNASTWVVLARKPEYIARLQRREWLDSVERQTCLALSAWPVPGLSALATVIAGANERPVWDPPAPRNQREAEMWENVGVWTDDFSNILSVFNWQKGEPAEEN